MTHGFGCACGAHRGVALGDPQSVTWCHCADCRRESGAPSFVWVGWHEANVEGGLAGLETRVTKANVTRGRCGSCGALLAYRDEGLPGLVYVPLGAFDAPERFEPTEHAYWPDRVERLSFDDGLPKREGTTQTRVARN